MLSNFKLITITHRKLNVNELEKFVIKYDDKEGLASALTSIKEEFQLEELFYLATCNRVQFLIYTNHDVDLEFTSRLFRKINPDLQDSDLEHQSKFVDIYEDTNAIDHIFSVASSIDSLVVGEREILRQYRDAYELSKSLKLTGDNIRLVDRGTVKAAKSVYANTKIGEKPVSIVSLAIQKILNKDLPKDARIILIGAGETNRLVGKLLKKNEYSNITIFNRSLDNAKELSKVLNASALHLSDLPNYSKGFDCLISCTGANEVLITPQLYDSILSGETDKKLIVDLAVPNNIDKTIEKSHEVSLIDIEHLRHLANENLSFRKDEVKVANKILRKEVQEFSNLYQRRQIEKAMADLPSEINAVKKRALEQVYKKNIELLDPNAQQLIAEMMDYMEKKCVSIPMKVAKATITS